jgi:hypothetical protein
MVAWRVVAGPRPPRHLWWAPRLRSEFVTFYLSLRFVAGKFPRASADKHRRGPSTPRIKLSVCDRAAKRFAQDDGFVGGLKCNWLHIVEKVTGSQDDKGKGNRPQAQEQLG